MNLKVTWPMWKPIPVIYCQMQLTGLREKLTAKDNQLMNLSTEVNRLRVSNQQLEATQITMKTNTCDRNKQVSVILCYFLRFFNDR